VGLVTVTETIVPFGAVTVVVTVPSGAVVTVVVSAVDLLPEDEADEAVALLLELALFVEFNRLSAAEPLPMVLMVMVVAPFENGIVSREA
jgi:hypothetical protein